MVEFEYDGNVFEVRSGRCYRTVNAVARIILGEGDFHQNYVEFCQGEAHDMYHGEWDSCPNLEAVEQYVKCCFFTTSLSRGCDDIQNSIEDFINLAETFERAFIDGRIAGL